MNRSSIVNALMGYAASDPSTADILRTPIRRGSLWPVSEYADGSAGFDQGSGLFGSIGRAITAPHRAYSDGMTDDQIRDEGSNFAGLFGLGGYAGAAAPSRNALMSMYKSFGPADAPVDAMRAARISGADRFIFGGNATTFANKRPQPYDFDAIDAANFNSRFFVP